MRLVVDAMPLLVRSAGVKNYLYHWIAHLRRAAPPGVSVDLFPWLGRLGPLDHEASQVGPLHTWLSLALFHFFNLATPRSTGSSIRSRRPTCSTRRAFATLPAARACPPLFTTSPAGPCRSSTPPPT
jgi:hypothetical protein